MKQEEAAAKKERKFSHNIDASVEIFKLGADYWTKVCNDLSKEDMLPYGDVAFIGSIAEQNRELRMEIFKSLVMERSVGKVRKKLPIGIDGFEKIRTNDFYYA